MYVVKDGCPGCSACRAVCPAKAIKLEKGKAVIDQAKCIQCGICAGACPVKLIKFEKGTKAAAARTEAKPVKNIATAEKEVGSDG